MKKKIILAVLAIGVIGVVAAVMMYNKPHKDYSKLKADYEVTASGLIEEFESDENEANSKYLDKVVQVQGAVESVTVLESGDVSIALHDAMLGVICNIDAEKYNKQKDDIDAIETGSIVTIKGRCDGMLSDVRLSKCSLVQ